MDEKAKHGQSTGQSEYAAGQSEYAAGQSEYAAGQGEYELAGLMTRALALMIDAFLLVAAVLICILVLTGIGDSLPDRASYFIGLVVPVAYHWYFWTQRDGQTPGKFALGIRVVKADGTAIRDTDAVIRAIGYQVSSWFFCLGYIWAIFDKNNQTWHDKLAGTYVVRRDDRRRMVDVG